MGLHIGLSLCTWVIIECKEWKHTDSLLKRVPGAAVIKVLTDSLQGHESVV